MAEAAQISVVDLRGFVAAKGYQSPVFPFLTPDEHRFSCLALQPAARIVDTPTGVFNSDHAAASAKHRAFFELLVEHQPDLAIVPEYACPWDLLEERLVAGDAPAEGKVWLIGCEAISTAQLQQRKEGLPESVIWLHEDLDELVSPPEGAFLDPVCFVFRAIEIETSAPVTVVVVQFKTTPMGGVVYEANRMIKGRTLFSVKNPADDSIRLLCLICSDALAYPNDNFAEVRALFKGLSSLLVVHIQLNAEPRQALYRAYRSALLQRQENRELICLNWARDVVLQSEGQAPQQWGNDSASALYSRRWHTRPLQDDVLEASEAKGIYFSYANELRSTVAFFNFSEHCFLMVLTKANQNLANPEHRIPQPPAVSAVFSWHEPTQSWTPATLPLDNESRTALQAAGINPAHLNTVLVTPLRFERFAAISIGSLVLKNSVRQSEWPDFKCVPAHLLDAAESIFRTSFSQDRCPIAKGFRANCYLRLSMFLGARGNPANFPKWMIGFRAHTFAYEVSLPYSNIRDPDGRPGTAVLMPTVDEVEAQVMRTRLEKHVAALASDGAHCDPLHIVTWIPAVQPGGQVNPQVFPELAVPKQTDDPNAIANQIDGEVE